MQALTGQMQLRADQLDYASLPETDALQLRAAGVCVESCASLLDADGNRVHDSQRRMGISEEALRAIPTVIEITTGRKNPCHQGRVALGRDLIGGHPHPSRRRRVRSTAKDQSPCFRCIHQVMSSAGNGDWRSCLGGRDVCQEVQGEYRRFRKVLDLSTFD